MNDKYKLIDNLLLISKPTAKPTFCGYISKIVDINNLEMTIIKVQISRII